MSKGQRKFNIPDPRRIRRFRESRAEKNSKSNAVHAEAVRMVTAELIRARANEPPADLHRFAKHVGVNAIRVVPLAMRGRVVLDNGKISVEVLDKLSAFEQKRTIAHELAHLVLERERIISASASGSNVRRSMSHTLIEQLCDDCGDEILLPRDWLHNRILQSTASLESVFKISEDVDLPVEFIVGQIIKLKLWPWRAFWFAKNGTQSQIAKSIPTWDEAFLLSVEVEKSHECPVAKCWAASGVVKGLLKLRIHGEANHYPAESAKLDDRIAICVVEIRR